ncbi:MAG: T9SS type A sorting domain-containing protein [Bacteroidota bacterium]
MKKIARLTLTLIILIPLSLVSLRAQQLKVTGGNLKVNNSSLVLQDMDLVNDGTLSSTDGNVVFTGTTTSTVSGTASVMFDSLTINKTSGEVQLEQDIMIGTHLALQSGNLDLQTSNASMADPSTISGASADDYVQTSSTGTLSRPVADADVTFPVGNSSYNPAILNNDGGTADFYSVRVRDELLEDGSSGAQVDEYGVNRTWEIAETTAGGSDLDVTLTWDAADEIGTTGSDYVQANYDGGMWNTVASGAAGSTFGLNSLGSTNNAAVGEYAIFEDRSPLTDSYICNDNGALDVPGTLSMTKNYHAGTVLTSDAVITASGSILYTAGTEIQLQTDFEVQNGGYFHAFIASCNFSNIDEVENRAAEELMSTIEQIDQLQVEVFPNPFNNQTNIKFFLPANDAVQLIITDLNGRTLKVKESMDTQEGWQQTNFEAGNLPSGNYLLVVRSNGQQVVKTLVVQE